MKPYAFASATLAALAAGCFFASQNGPATFALSRLWIDPYSAAMWLAVGAVGALCLAVSPSLRAVAAKAMQKARRLGVWFAGLDMLRGKCEEGKLPPATWPVLALCRMFLALVVVVHHTSIFSHEGPFLHAIMSLDGDKAVLLFFFVSGYSIAHSVTKEPQDFYKRRA